MKKLMLLLLAVAFLGLNQADAQKAAKSTEKEVPMKSETITDYDSPTEVALADLPKAVQVALKADDYQGWTFAKAWHVKKEGAEYYKVKMKRGDEMSKVKLTADGKLYEGYKKASDVKDMR